MFEGVDEHMANCLARMDSKVSSGSRVKTCTTLGLEKEQLHTWRQSFLKTVSSLLLWHHIELCHIQCGVLFRLFG